VVPASTIALSDVQLVLTVQKAEPQLAHAQAGSKARHAMLPRSAGINVFIRGYFMFKVVQCGFVPILQAAPLAGRSTIAGFICRASIVRPIIHFG
jgi:hypothetical protein